MRPRAPLGDTAAGLKPDSTSITDLTSRGSSEWSFAARLMSGSNCEGREIRAASHCSLPAERFPTAAVFSPMPSL